MKIISVIPARAGSKGIVGKNIVDFLGYPLIAHTIAASKMSKLISRTIVSTDSPQIQNIAKRYGADAPFLRPSSISQDHSTDREFFLHMLSWLWDHERYAPDLIVHLRPTTPLRNPEVIDDAVYEIMNCPTATSLRSAHLSLKCPYKWFEIDDLGFFRGIRESDSRDEYYNLPRQSFPPVYDPNGYVDVIRSNIVLSTDTTHGQLIKPFITPYCHELDSPEDLMYLSYIAEKLGSKVLSFLNESTEIDRS